MKVIRLGADTKAWKHQFKCHYCKSELEAEADDLTYAGDPGDWHDAGWENYSVNCSACGQGHTINPNDIPNLVKVYAQRRSKK